MKLIDDRLINQTSHKHIISVIHLVSLMPDINEVIDYITILHIDFTVHWHPCDDDYKTELIIVKYLNCDKGLSVKFKHIIHDDKNIIL